MEFRIYILMGGRQSRHNSLILFLKLAAHLTFFFSGDEIIMTSLEFVTSELGTTPKELTQKCRNRDLVHKRWIAACFYRLMGLSLLKIGLYLNLDHQTVLHGIRNADESMREKAREMYLKFTNQEPDSQILPKKTKIVTIPNYHTGEVITKEVEI